MAICSTEVGRLADLDAVTLDANGTLIGLVDPVPKLERILKEHGLEREPAAIRRAVEAEGAVYATRAVDAHQPAAFASLQRECTGVFLAEVGADGLDPHELAPAYVGAMAFELLPGVEESLALLRSCGLELAVVANFDLTLSSWFERLGLANVFTAVVTPRDAGVAKPDPAIFQLALEQLGVRADRALHVGDGQADAAGAEAAGMHFEWSPLPEALARWS